MSHVRYTVVEHDGGWAYLSQGVYSETFSTQEAARRAALRAAMEQTLPDATRDIEYQDADGRWRTEVAEGDDRPEVEVDGVTAPG